MGKQGKQVRTQRGTGRSVATRIVLMAASPSDQDALHIASEHRAIRSILRGAMYRDDFDVLIRGATQAADLFEVLCEDHAAILHFSGHGEAEGLALEDASGQTRVFPADALRDAVAAAPGVLRLVVLGACGTAPVARALAKVVDCAIGVDATILDTSIRAFTEAFYRAMFSGLSVALAFDQGRAAARAVHAADARRIRMFSRSDIDRSALVFGGAAARRPRRIPTPRARPAAAGGDDALLARVKSRRNLEWELPDRLEWQLAELFPETATVGQIVDEATRLLRRSRPDETCIHRGRVVFTNAWTAWSTLLSEAARISPRSLLAVLLAARRRTQTATTIDTAIQTVLEAK